MVPQCLQDTVLAFYYALDHSVYALPGCRLSLIYSASFHDSSVTTQTQWTMSVLVSLPYMPVTAGSGWRQRHSCQDMVQVLKPLGRPFYSRTMRGYASISLCFQLLVIQRMVPGHQHHVRACYKCRISGPF